MDDEPRPRVRFDDESNGAERQRRKDNLDWSRVLEETQIHTMDDDDRRRVKELLLWVKSFRNGQRARRRAATAALAVVIPMAGIIGGWVEASISKGCPTGYVCVPTALPATSPSP